jgi:two-component system, sensor histidine kinase RegB
MATRVSLPPASMVEPGEGRVLGEPSTTDQTSVRAFLTSVDPIPEGTAERWLINLRWAAIVGMTATTATAKLLVPALATFPIFAILTALALINGMFALVVGRVLRHERRLIAAQIAFDVLALGAVLWVSGGTGNPFAAFLVFQIALAGVLCGGRPTLGIAALTMVIAALVSFADPLPLESAPLGKERIHHLSAFVSVASLSGFLGLFVFVHARRLDELRQRAVRNEKLAMLGRVVGGMSHELSTPLATILLAGRELSEITREGPPEAAELARMIAGEAQRASDIIGLVRGYIRPDQRREEVELGKFVSDVATRELRRLEYRGELHIDAPDPVRITVLSAGLLQVLLNVLTNAAEAMVATERRHIHVSVREKPEFAEIIVEDSGPGFRTEMIARLGEPFQTTKDKQGGMGLGLYVSSVLLDRMNGVLCVSNAEQGGARVVIRLARDIATCDAEV